MPQSIKFTFSLWGATAYNDILHLDTTTRNASPSTPEFHSVFYEQQIPGNAAGLLQRAQLCSTTPAGIPKTNWWPTRLHHSLDVTWTKFLMTIGLPWLPAHFFQVTKNELWDLECAGNCLDSIVCWTEMNFSDPFRTPPRYQASQECREKEHMEMLEKQNHKWPWNNDAKETSILKGEKSLFLFGSHLTHSLPVVTERCQKTREIFTFNHGKSIIWQFSYNSSLLGLTQRKEKILRRGVNRKEVKKKNLHHVLKWQQRLIPQTRNVTEVKTSCSNRSSH